MSQIIGLQYFGNLSYYKILFVNTYVVFDQYERHEKRSFNNRCAIAGANGPILLSIPLEKGRLQTSALKDIKICNNESWQKKHWRSLVSSYNASPWFPHYTDSLAEMYLKPYIYLIDWNLACLDWILNKIKVELVYDLTTQPRQPGFNNESCSAAEMKVRDTDTTVRYQQVFESKTGFIPNLSILDLLFCTGPKISISLLKSE